MIIFRLIIIGVCSLVLANGCASHYYRKDQKETSLYLRQPGAERVLLYSSIDGFSPRVAERSLGGWVVSMPSDQAFNYFYEVDGRVMIPHCPLKEKDDFGFENCVYEPGL